MQFGQSFRLDGVDVGLPHDAHHLLDAGHQRSSGPFAEAACIPQEALKISDRFDAFDDFHEVAALHAGRIDARGAVCREHDRGDLHQLGPLADDAPLLRVFVVAGLHVAADA
ncbi:hypothetical protein D3C86_1632870 [compost metagenome]